LDEKDKRMYLQLAGRVLLIFLFIGFVFSGEWSISRILVSMVGCVACVMVVVGFKAKWSATLLVVILSIFNIIINNFWTVSYLRYVADRAGINRHIASSSSSSARFRQVRFLPNPLHCVSTPPSAVSL